MLAPCSAQRRLAPLSAVRRADPTLTWCVRVSDSTGLYFNYLDYYFEIPVNEFFEFFVKRHLWGAAVGSAGGKRWSWLFQPVTRAKAVDACRESAAGAAAGADGALRIDTERYFWANLDSSG